MNIHALPACSSNTVLTDILQQYCQNWNNTVMMALLIEISCATAISHCTKRVIALHKTGGPEKVGDIVKLLACEHPLGTATYTTHLKISTGGWVDIDMDVPCSSLPSMGTRLRITVDVQQEEPVPVTHINAFSMMMSAASQSFYPDEKIPRYVSVCI